MTGIYLLLGSNLGKRTLYLQQAINRLVELYGPITIRSSIYQTEAWEMQQSPPFLNQVLLIETDKSPLELLQAILKIETSLGRVRQKHYTDRTIDIDILYYHDQVLTSPELVIPHPRISQRRFVLEPLVEIAPEFKHPVFDITNTELLAQCEDPLSVIKFQ